MQRLDDAIQVIQCEKCGYEFPPHAIFCSKCGHLVNPKACEQRTRPGTNTRDRSSTEGTSNDGNRRNIGWYWPLEAHTARITYYFSAAAWAFLIGGDESAFQAAFTAGVVLDTRERQHAVRVLQEQVRTIEKAVAGSTNLDNRHSLVIVEGKNRVEMLADAVMHKDWTLADVDETKGKLAQHDDELLRALNRSDPTLFLSRYPMNPYISRLFEQQEVHSNLPREALLELEKLGVKGV